jgi:hypothetical protein
MQLFVDEFEPVMFHMLLGLLLPAVSPGGIFVAE